jgi:hypothetical protein
MVMSSIYQEPALLDRNEHRDLRLKPQPNFDFVKNLNSVPVAGPEFFETSRDWPVVFSKGGEGEFMPMALLSLRLQGNTMGDNWGGVYMPAFIRRYPFALADGKVLFDKKAPHLQQQEGEALFGEGGENSDFLNKIIEFLAYTDVQFKVTREYCRACADNDLFTSFKAQVRNDEGTQMRLDNLFIIDEQKLKQLPDEQIGNWFRKGWLAWSYAHLHSLGAVPRLVKRDRENAARRQTDPTEA